MNSAARPVLRVVVLAAGFSARLGQPKARARVLGMSLVRRTVRLLAPLAGAAIIVVVPPKALRTRVELRGYRLAFAENARRAEGLSSSVRCGLRHARYAAGALLLPVDLPNLERRDMARLIRRWNGARRRVVATRVGDFGAAPLILPRRHYPSALRIVGDVGLKHFVRQLPKSELTLVDLPSAAADVDTPRDLQRARRRVRAALR